tara:strand:+ start:1393 stop:2304 length:912 start_codon:yes stop_codon:yes gene_type:complete
VIDILKPLIQQFMPFAQEKMGFSRPPKLFLRQDTQNAADPLGKTGFYDPEKESITLYTTGRHPKDIMRSLAHELQHHTQKCNGDFESVQNMGEEGYAQADPHMRTMEIQAYQASIVFRDWEDSCKGTIYYEHLQKGDNVSMSTKKWKNGELKYLLTEAWGFQMDLSKLNEERTGSGIDHGGDDDEEAEEETEGTADSKSELYEDINEDSGEEEKHHYEDNAWNDEDHIEAIEKHLRALKKDKDYDEDHESLEEDGAKRKGDPRLRRPDADRLRESVAKLHKAGLSESQIKKFLTASVSKVLKG